MDSSIRPDGDAERDPDLDATYARSVAASLAAIGVESDVREVARPDRLRGIDVLLVLADFDFRVDRDEGRLADLRALLTAARSRSPESLAVLAISPSVRVEPRRDG